MWYLFQLGIIIYLCYIYATKLTPDETPGRILAWAILVSYVATWLLCKLYDLLLRLRNILTKTLTWASQQRRIGSRLVRRPTAHPRLPRR
jgi:hypothetical protein